LKDVKDEFTCENTDDWKSHTVGLTDTGIVGWGYQVLANGIVGPQIFAHFNTIALQFPIKKLHE